MAQGRRLQEVTWAPLAGGGGSWRHLQGFGCGDNGAGAWGRCSGGGDTQPGSGAMLFNDLPLSPSAFSPRGDVGTRRAAPRGPQNPGWVSASPRVPLPPSHRGWHGGGDAVAQGDTAWRGRRQMEDALSSSSPRGGRQRGTGVRRVPVPHAPRSCLWPGSGPVPMSPFPPPPNPAPAPPSTPRSGADSRRSRHDGD